MKLLAAVTALAFAVVPAQALAWGGMGHRLIGQAAVRALPAEAPAFLRSPQAVLDIGELSREPDRTRGFGKEHDLEAMSGHFIDIDENGKVLGGPPFAPLPPTRQGFEKSLQPFGLNSWQTGYLPYSIFDRWQTLTKDFAEWRVLHAAEANPKWRAHRAWYAAERRRREALILTHVGELSHYVGDGSQPLHGSSHYNGWGDFPNPKGYTQAHIHSPFEGDLVNRTVTRAAIEAQMTPLEVCGCAIEQEVSDYLLADSSQVEPLYELEKAGGLALGDPRGTAFAVTRLAVGASKVRNLIVEAWRTSPGLTVGWKPVAVADVVSGKIEPYPALFGAD